MTIFFSLIPFIFLIYSIILSYRRESISYDIKKGYICYSCKSEIDTFDDRVQRLMNSQIKLDHITLLEKPTICKSCDRESKLNQLSRLGFFYSMKSKLDSYLILDKSNKLILLFITTFIPCLILDMYFLNEYRFFFYLGQFFQTVYWLLIIRRQYLTTIKKPSE